MKLSELVERFLEARENLSMELKKAPRSGRGISDANEWLDLARRDLDEFVEQVLVREN